MNQERKIYFVHQHSSKKAGYISLLTALVFCVVSIIVYIDPENNMPVFLEKILATGFALIVIWNFYRTFVYMNKGGKWYAVVDDEGFYYSGPSHTKFPVLSLRLDEISAIKETIVDGNDGVYSVYEVCSQNGKCYTLPFGDDSLNVVKLFNILKQRGVQYERNILS